MPSKNENKKPVMSKDVISDLMASFPQLEEGVDCIYDRNFVQDVKIPTEKGDMYVILFPAEKEKPSYLEGLRNALNARYFNGSHNFEVERAEIHGMFPGRKLVALPYCISRHYKGFEKLPDKGWDKSGFAIERHLEAGKFTGADITSETRKIMNAV